MSEPSSERVSCPECGKGYRWQPSLTGRMVPCKQCQTTFTVPDSPGVGLSLKYDPPTDDGTYDLADPQADAPAPLAVPARGGKCPNCNSPIKEHAVLCMNCGFNMREGKRIQTAVMQPVDAGDAAAQEQPPGPISRRENAERNLAADIHAGHRWIDYKLPVILIITGCLLALINNALLAPNSPALSEPFTGTGEVILAYTLGTAYSTAVNFVLLFAGLLLLVWLFSASFGSLGSVLLKVLAISLVAQELDFGVIAMMDVTMGTGMLGIYVSWAVYLGAMIGLCIKLLDVDMTEFRVLIIFIIIGRVVADFTLQLMIDRIF